MTAKRGIESEKTFQPVIFDMLIQHVRDIHEQHAQEIAHVLLAEPAQRDAGHGHGRRFRKGHAAQIGGSACEQGFEDPGVAEELTAQSAPCLLFRL